jgi:hypothetical protein
MGGRMVVICPTTQATTAATKQPDGEFAHATYAWFCG